MTEPASGPTTPWLVSIRDRFEAEFVRAVEYAEERAACVMESGISVSTAKQLLSDLTRKALRSSTIPFMAAPSGNSDVEYLVLRGVAVVRAKGLNKHGKPSNYPTQRNREYLAGEQIDALPDLPRVDLSYALNPLTLRVESVALIEWGADVARAIYRLPWGGDGRSFEEALPLPFPGPEITRRDGTPLELPNVHEEQA